MKLTNEQEAALRALPLSAARIHPVSGDALVAADGIYARIVAETGEFVGLDADEHAAAVAEIDATVAHLAARAAAEAAETAARIDGAQQRLAEVLDLLAEQIPGAARADLAAVIDRFYGDGLRVVENTLDDGYGDGALERFSRLLARI